MEVVLAIRKQKKIHIKNFYNAIHEDIEGFMDCVFCLPEKLSWKELKIH